MKKAQTIKTKATSVYVVNGNDLSVIVSSRPDQSAAYHSYGTTDAAQYAKQVANLKQWQREGKVSATFIDVPKEADAVILNIPTPFQKGTMNSQDLPKGADGNVYPLDGNYTRINFYRYDQVSDNNGWVSTSVHGEAIRENPSQYNGNSAYFLMGEKDAVADAMNSLLSSHPVIKYDDPVQ